MSFAGEGCVRRFDGGGEGESDKEGERVRFLLKDCGARLMEGSLEEDGTLRDGAEGRDVLTKEGLESCSRLAKEPLALEETAVLVDDDLASDGAEGLEDAALDADFLGMGAAMADEDEVAVVGSLVAGGVLVPDAEGEADEWGRVCDLGFVPNQLLNSRASSPSRTWEALAFARSCRISSMVRVSRLLTLSFVRVLGIAASRARTEPPVSGDESA